MNHESYENWIFNNGQITQSQRIELKHHLEECDQCNQLSQRWQTVETTLKNATIKQAPRNFSKNWLASLATRRREQEKRQAQTLIISLASGLVAILIAGTVLIMPDLSLISIVARIMTSCISLSSALINFWSIMLSLIQTIPPSMLVITGTLVSSWIIFGCSVWGYSIWKLAIKRGLTK